MKTKNILIFTKVFAPFFSGCLGAVLYFEYYFNWRELLSAQTISNGANNTEIIFTVPNITFWGGLLPSVAIFIVFTIASILFLNYSINKYALRLTIKPVISCAIVGVAVLVGVYSILFAIRQMWLLQPIIISFLIICILLGIVTTKALATKIENNL